jgi:hypothetical protein
MGRIITANAPLTLNARGRLVKALPLAEHGVCFPGMPARNDAAGPALMDYSARPATAGLPTVNFA